MPAMPIEAVASGCGTTVSYQFLDDTSATASSLRKDGFWTVHTEPGAEPLWHDMQDHWQCPGTYRHAQGTAAHRGMTAGGVRGRQLGRV